MDTDNNYNNLNQNENKNQNENQNEIIKNKKKRKKSNVPKCNLDGCNKNQSIIVGMCKWCNLCYCSTHRLPESHLCSHLNKCKEVSFNNNEKKLNQQKTISNKVVKI